MTREISHVKLEPKEEEEEGRDGNRRQSSEQQQKAARDMCVMVAAHLAMNRPADALAPAHAAVRLCPMDGELWSLLGVVKRKLNMPEADVLLDMDEGVRLRPSHWGLRVWRAEARIDYGRLKGALEDLDAAVLACAQDAHALTLRGVVKHRMGRTQEALVDLDAALALSSTPSTSVARSIVSGGGGM